MMSELVVHKTLEDYCACREAVMADIRQAYALLDSAEERFKSVYTYGLPSEITRLPTIDKVQREVDQSLWRVAMDDTGFMKLMDKQARDDFERDVVKATPPFTNDFIRSTFLALAQQSETMFARGVVNVFLRLSRAHKTNTNSPFKVNAKAILSYMVDNAGPRMGFTHHWGAREQLNDIDRVFKSLDGVDAEEYALANAIAAAMASRLSEYEDGYYRFKWFGNGNMHVTFKRADLLDRANLVIHDYFEGTALAGGNPRRARDK